MNKKTVHYLFSKNSKIGSRLIRWGTAFLCPWVKYEDVPSHVAILVDGKWVLESTLTTGVRIIPYSTWKQINTEICKLQCLQEREFSNIKDFYRAIELKTYDYPGILYFSWRIILKKLFNIDLPKENKWQSDDKYFCSEVIGKMTGLDYQMTSPVQLQEMIKECLHC